MNKIFKGGCAFLFSLTLIAVCGCGEKAPETGQDSDAAAQAPKFKSIDPNRAVFWTRQTQIGLKLLRSLVHDFNEGREGLEIHAEPAGNYGDIFKKVSAGIHAKSLPSMAEAYESMTYEYAKAGAAIALDDFVKDPQLGFTQADLDDIFPAFIETNTYTALGGKMYSFPFAKSVLMLYFNKRVLDKAGISEPPGTWEEFIEQCRQIKDKTGKFAYAASIDCSTVDGILFSMGGDILRGAETLYDSPESLKVFEIFETLSKEKLAYYVTPGTFDDQAAFVQDKVAFVFRTSVGQIYFEELMQGDRDSWGMVRIPQDDPSRPGTILFGPNVSIFATTEEQQRTAWEFMKYFTSKDVSVTWALGSGYLPIRRSAVEDERMQKHWAQWEYNREAYDCLDFARAEPNLPGWQQIRPLVENAQTAVMAGLKTAKKATTELKLAADVILQENL